MTKFCFISKINLLFSFQLNMLWTRGLHRTTRFHLEPFMDENNCSMEWSIYKTIHLEFNLTIWKDKIRLMGNISFPIFLIVSKQRAIYKIRQHVLGDFWYPPPLRQHPSALYCSPPLPTSAFSDNYNEKLLKTLH